MNNNNKKPYEIDSEIYQAIIVALSDDAIFSITDEKGNIIYANQKFTDISQYSLDELVGQNHRMLKSGHQPQEMFVGLWQTISSGRVWHGELKNRAKDGTYYWVEATIIPVFDSKGKIVNYAALRIIINDKKEIEEKNKKYLENLEKINKITVDREMKMIELKKEIEILKEDLAKKSMSGKI